VKHGISAKQETAQNLKPPMHDGSKKGSILQLFLTIDEAERRNWWGRGADEMYGLDTG
jgi:hypothetical protein